MWITNGMQGDELGLGDVFLIYANTGIFIIFRELGIRLDMTTSSSIVVPSSDAIVIPPVLLLCYISPL